MEEKQAPTLSSYVSGAGIEPDKNPKKLVENHEDFNKLRDKLNSFKKVLLKKFPFIRSLGLLPVKAFPLFEEEEIPAEFQKEVKEKKPLHLIMVIPEEEYKNLQKIKPEVVKIAKESGEKLWVHIKTEVDLWNYGLDSKFNFVDAISACMPLHDSGFLGALRVANIHKSLVLGKIGNVSAQQLVLIKEILTKMFNL